MSMNRSVGLLLVSGLTSAAGAGEPLLGVSGIEIPGRFLELRDVDADGIDDVVFMRTSDSTTIEAMGYMPGQPGFGFGVPLIVEGLDIGYSFDPKATVGILDQTGLPTVVVIDNYQMRAYQSVNGQAALVFEDWFIPGDPVDDFYWQKELWAGDLDADGLTDMLLLRQDSFVIRWGGRQPFTRYQQFMTPGPVVTLPIRDYNADGFEDVLIVMEDTGELVLYPGGPIDKLGAPIHIGIAIPLPGGLFDLVTLAQGVGDFDADPALDLVYYDEFGQAVFLLNFATQSRETRLVQHPLGIQGWGVPMAVGDLNADGFDDLRISTGEPSSPITPWAETTAVWTNVLDDVPGVVEFWGHATFFPTLFGSLVRCIDTDSDGRSEIVTFGEDISVLHRRTSAPGPYEYGGSAGPARTSHVHMISTDLDGDGLPELVNSGGQVMVIDAMNLGEPLTFPDISSSFMSASYNPVDDGLKRIVTGGSGIRIIAFGPDKHPVSVTDVAAPGVDGYETGVCTGDFDGDGIEDAAVTVADTIQLFRWAGHTAEWYAAVDTPGSIKPAAVDLNGDGLTDLMVGNTDADRVAVLENQGGGSFIEVASWSTTANYWLETGDFDGDGLIDLAGVNGSSGSFTGEVSAAVWYGLPEGGFGPEVAVRSEGRQLEIVAADLDGDGLTDFVLPGDGPSVGAFSPSDDQTVMYRQVAPREYEFVARLPGWISVGAAVADLNGDGATDVATVYNDGRRTFIHWGTPAPCLADVNGDGSADFFDLAAFVATFQAQSSDADLAEPFGIWNFFDMAAFIQIYNAGCP